MCCASPGQSFISSEEHCPTSHFRPCIKLAFLCYLFAVYCVAITKGLDAGIYRKCPGAKTANNAIFRRRQEDIAAQQLSSTISCSYVEKIIDVHSRKTLKATTICTDFEEVVAGDFKPKNTPSLPLKGVFAAKRDIDLFMCCLRQLFFVFLEKHNNSAFVNFTSTCETINCFVDELPSDIKISKTFHGRPQINVNYCTRLLSDILMACPYAFVSACQREKKLSTVETESKRKLDLNTSTVNKNRNRKREISKQQLAYRQKIFNNTSRWESSSAGVIYPHTVSSNDSLFPSFQLHFPKNAKISAEGNQNVIYIHGLFEKTGGDCRTQPEAGPYELLAAKLAIKHINDGNIIPGYQLSMYYNDTKCDSGVAVDSFFYCLYRLPTMMMMLGTGSSEVTERLARVVSRWNIIQVSYGASSPALSDRKNFPFFFRTVAPDSSHNAALLAFIQHHRWDTVATLHEQGDNHALPMTRLVTELEQANISVSLTKGVSERDYKEHLQELKAQDCRILIGSFSLSLVRKIFCQVYHLEMFGSDYAWILQGDLKEPWWMDPRGTECSKGELSRASLGAIVVGSHYGLDGNITSVSGNTIEDILSSIGFHTDPRTSGFVSQTYDAVWAMALALSKAREQWHSEQNNVTFGDFSYVHYEMAEDIANILSKLRFVGVSGPVSFYNSDRVGITSFHQNQGEEKELSLVCLHYPHSGELHFDCAGCTAITWQGSRVPIARRIIKLRVAVLDRGVLICITSLAAFGVVLALLFLSFNLYFRRFKFIKLSSPNLNNFVVVGCILVYVAMILLGMDYGSLASETYFSFICTARAFLLSGGFSLAFGCMFIKTYRVYHIFIRSNSGIVKSKLLHDKQLLGMVSVLVMVDCFLVTLWVTLDPMERQLRNLTMQVNPLERNVVYLYQREQCYSVHMVKWLGSLYIYKGLLLVVGCYMAWETRHVKIPALNDSQYIGMSVYNVVITSIIVVALANVIPVERYTLTFVLVSALIFVSTTMTLCLLFLPKIHTILTNPEGGGAVVATPGVKVEFRTRRFALDEPRESMYRAEVLNRALKRELMELEEELARLSEKMGIAPPDLHKSKVRSLDSKQQDDDSDDDLPPWLDEYKKYPSNGSNGVWYTSSRDRPGACFSMLSAMHPLLISTAADCPSPIQEHPSTSTSPEQICGANIPQKEISSVSQICVDLMRSSLPAMTMIDNRQKMTAPILDPVHTSLSDRALNKIKYPKKCDQQQTPAATLTKLYSAAALQFKQYSKSATRLPNEWCNSDGQAYNYRPTGSLPKISADDRSYSAMSANTVSCGSEWTTAPQYSSSFATAPEGSSSNNRTLVTPSQTPDPQKLPRDSLTDSSNGVFLSDDSCSNNGQTHISEMGNANDVATSTIKNAYLQEHKARERIHNLAVLCDEPIVDDSPCTVRVTDSMGKSRGLLESDLTKQSSRTSESEHLIPRSYDARNTSAGEGSPPQNSGEESDTNVTDLSSPTSSSLESSDYTNCENSADTLPCFDNPDSNEVSFRSGASRTYDIQFVDAEDLTDSETTRLLGNPTSISIERVSTEHDLTPNESSTPLLTVKGINANENIASSTLVLDSPIKDGENIGQPDSKSNIPEPDQRNSEDSKDGVLYNAPFQIHQENDQLPLDNETRPNTNNDQAQYENLRQIFELERDLILLELEKSEAVDL